MADTNPVNFRRLLDSINIKQFSFQRLPGNVDYVQLVKTHAFLDSNDRQQVKGFDREYVEQLKQENASERHDLLVRSRRLQQETNRRRK